jgi:F-type H+-transporting ATPase subunit b
VTHSAATAGQHTTTTAPAAEGGLPQFEFQHWGGQIAYLLLLFAILYVLVSRVFAPRIRRVFDERARVIAEALASARTVQDEANAHAQAARQAVADARARAQRTAADAKARTAAESKERQAQLENELAAKLGEAEARIGAARDQAMANVAGIAGETAQAIVEKLTGTAAPRGAAEAAVAKLQE